jgi:hypothetical protein
VGTPGRRKALKALARAKKRNKRRLKQGKKPIIEGKKVSLSTYYRKTGAKRPKKKGNT